MRVLYIDSANLDEIKEAFDMGVVRGITTNPSLLAKEPKQNYEKLIDDIAAFALKNKLDLSVEVLATNPEDIEIESIKLNQNYKSNTFFNVKIPVGVEELKIIKNLSRLDIKVNCTACFNQEQLCLAATAGARKISLFYNRARDMGVDVNEVLQQTRKFIDENKWTDSCRIISGSIRKPQDVLEAWEAGSDIVTCSLKIMKEMLEHEGTKKSVEGFTKDFENWLK